MLVDASDTRILSTAHAKGPKHDYTLFKKSAPRCKPEVWFRRLPPRAGDVADSGYQGLASRHLGGHFSTWGGSVLTDEAIGSRPLRFFETLLVYGLGGGASPLRIAVSLCWFSLSVLGLVSLLRGKSFLPLAVSFVWLVPYALWMYLGHDVDLARYHFPLVAGAVLLAGLGLPKQMRVALPVIGVSILLVGVVSLPLAYRHSVTPSLHQQVASYIDQNMGKETSALLTSSTELLRYAKTYAKGLYIAPIGADAKLIESRLRSVQGWKPTVLSTSYTLGQLEASATEDWVPIARFCQDPYLRSRGASEFVLYQHQPDAPDVPLPGCESLSGQQGEIAAGKR